MKKQFPQSDYCDVFAQGKQLEEVLLKRFNSTFAVFLVEFNQEFEFKREKAHQNREFEYCTYHKGCKGEHCALDDARYLAKCADQ